MEKPIIIAEDSATTTPKAKKAKAPPAASKLLFFEENSAWIAFNIKAIRVKRKMLVGTLAELAKLPPATIIAIEKNKYPNITIINLFNIARGLRVNIRVLTIHRKNVDIDLAFESTT